MDAGCAVSVAMLQAAGQEPAPEHGGGGAGLPSADGSKLQTGGVHPPPGRGSRGSSTIVVTD